jgi:hypothetical protein
LVVNARPADTLETGEFRGFGERDIIFLIKDPKLIWLGIIIR